MGLGELSPWHLLILAAVLLLLFGAKKLPDSARSLGRAMRIFKAETAGLRDHHDSEDGRPQPAAPQQLPASSPAMTQHMPGETRAAGATVPETQHTSQPG